MIVDILKSCEYDKNLRTSIIRMHHARLHRPIYDEDFALFKTEVQQMIQEYNDSGDNNKILIRQKLNDAIRNCKLHIGGDLAYSTTPLIQKNFAKFYTPRLVLLKKALSQMN
ncbi:hypothetical protein TVAG_036130 [Trichomonas vaginalis G3]|uniref:Uncharacterized protein n=1 Tax=Trichomonas vaginalis (strain ATCC PRA-98 / G3) TaxID=412133 RepID=A2DAT5_TRIV3|nr:hypothetical protein TVAGG3_0812630 [Trichomonas vaginalis G3]EAY22588.1 hypothetical protein TVAG_036130 [Trichomonas vaginalis G3]KAI5497320.1 hypothetical protein TVAGG3_0812630 [Trichomonas vaginalis G3]|eukprot:XP_001583574.1 hypothetical protein [Trichomonas vaginalis G3]